MSAENLLSLLGGFRCILPTKPEKKNKVTWTASNNARASGLQNKSTWFDNAAFLFFPNVFGLCFIASLM